MAIISGKIESLKRLKESLNNRGIYRFNSIGDINTFLKSYDSERETIPTNVKNVLDEEVSTLNHELAQLTEKSNKNIINKVFYYFKLRELTKKFDNFTRNYESILLKRCTESYHKLEFTRKTVNDLYSLVAGALGENAVVNEVRKLSNKYYLINDFSLKFNPPIYNKRENDRIFSIQIDHLLVSQSGIFIIETKNWNTQSIERIDLRSPVDQIKRANYALFVYLNSASKVELTHHHWGIKKIPIRNIILMINASPKEDFQHVKVLPLNKLNGYVQYFDEVFSESETLNIFEYLKSKVS